MRVWRKYGLAAPGWLGTRDADPRFSLLPRPTRFRMALEEKGGLWPLFGQYLAGRADLLTSPYLRQLGRIARHREPLGRGLLEQELGGKFTAPRLVRVAPASDVYLVRQGERPVVVELYAPRGSVAAPAEWRTFRREVRALEGSAEDRITHPGALDHFEEWCRLAGDIERRRTMLGNLESVPEGCVCRFPRLIPEFQTAHALAHEAMEGEPLWTADGSDETRRKGLSLLVEALLEQSLLLSIVDAECRPELYCRLPGGRIGFRALPAWGSVPVEWHYEIMQYLASTVAGQSPRALHMLARISAGHDPYASEQRLMRDLSGLQPELKINQITPASVTALENYWRALALTHMHPPLFLQLFHRQWTIAGQLNGDAVPSEDMIAELLWPVMGRILRMRLAELGSMEKSSEWAASSGLLMLTAARQMGMVLEQVRDNDLALVLERQEYEPRGTKVDRRAAAGIRSTMALAIFIVAAYSSLGSAGAAWQAAAIAATMISALAAVFLITRIE